MKRRKTGFAWLTTFVFLFTSIAIDRAQAETTDLRIAYQHSMAFLVVDVMLGKKLIEARAAAVGLNALKVSTVRFASGPAANDALLKGDVEVGGAGVAPFLDLWAKTRGGANVRGIAPINNSPLYLISTDARIQTPKDLGSVDKIAVPAPGSIQGLFLRSFAAFAASNLPARVHEALIKKVYADCIVGHIARDATAIEAREAPVRTDPAAPGTAKRKRGRPKKGEVVVAKQPRRLERQAGQTLAEMLADLPSRCNVGTKRNAKGHTTSWIGYKLHIDTADGDIPVSCILTSASVHDSQVALPLATITAGRIVNLYDLMDSAYDVQEIHDKSRALGHVPIIDHKTRRGEKAAIAAEAAAKRTAGYELCEDVRYRQRSSAERVNANLKDNSGGNHVRVRGAAKVFCHLMFGILVVAVEQIMRLVT